MAYTNTKNAMAMVFVTRHAGMTNPSAAKSGDWRVLAVRHHRQDVDEQEHGAGRGREQHERAGDLRERVDDRREHDQRRETRIARAGTLCEETTPTFCRVGECDSEAIWYR